MDDTTSSDMVRYFDVLPDELVHDILYLVGRFLFEDGEQSCNWINVFLTCKRWKRIAYDALNPEDYAIVYGSPLETSCKTGNLSAVKRLLSDKRTNPGRWNNLALCTACKSGFPDIVYELLQDSRILTMKSSLHCCASLKECDSGLRLPISGHRSNSKATANDHHNYDDTNSKEPDLSSSLEGDTEKNFCLYIACSMGFTEIVRILLNSPKIDPTRRYGCLSIACYGGFRDIVRLLLQDGRIDPSYRSNTLIRKTVHKGIYHKIVKMLLADPRVDPSAGSNSLIVQACRENQVKMVKLLLQHPKVDPTVMDCIALRIACKSGYYEIVQMLLHWKSCSNNDTATPYHDLTDDNQRQQQNTIRYYTRSCEYSNCTENDDDDDNNYTSISVPTMHEGTVTLSNRAETTRKIKRRWVQVDRAENADSNQLAPNDDIYDNQVPLKRIKYKKTAVEHGNDTKCNNGMNSDVHKNSDTCTIKIVKTCDPSVREGECLLSACSSAYLEIVSLLLKDQRVDTMVRKGAVFFHTLRTGFFQLFQTLLYHPTTNMTTDFARVLIFEASDIPSRQSIAKLLYTFIRERDRCFQTLDLIVSNRKYH